MPREHKIALITGANKGIGFEVARQLARQKFRVFIGARDTNAGKAAAEKLRREHETEKDRNSVTATFLQMDVSSPHSIRAAAEEFSRHANHLDVLVTNAGIALDEDKDILKISPETLETTLRTNTLGPLLVSQAFVSFLRKSSAPRIVNVSSGGGQLADGAEGWSPAYCISKTALNGVTSQLAAARCRKSRLTLSVPVGSGPIWVAPRQRVRWEKVRPASSGSRPMHRKTRPANSGAIAKSFRGRRLTSQINLGAGLLRAPKPWPRKVAPGI